jgi:hypothetical protein
MGVSDKTAAEINSAVTNRKIPVVFTSYNGSLMRAFLTGFTSTSAIFLYNNIGWVSNETRCMVINTSGGVTVT